MYLAVILKEKTSGKKYERCCTVIETNIQDEILTVSYNIGPDKHNEDL